jgi:hypothetical protein
MYLCYAILSLSVGSHKDKYYNHAPEWRIKYIFRPINECQGFRLGLYENQNDKTISNISLPIFGQCRKCSPRTLIGKLIYELNLQPESVICNQNVCKSPRARARITLKVKEYTQRSK